MSENSSKITLARKRARLTQAQMAELLEIPTRTIENWEGKKSTPPTWAEKLIIEKLTNIAKERGFIMNYYINYQTSAGNEWVEGTLEDAIQTARENAAYTQQSIAIYESDCELDGKELYMLCQNEPIAKWTWYGVLSEDESDDIIIFGSFGHYALEK